MNFPFPNFGDATFEVWEDISNSIWNLTMGLQLNRIL